ncbi:MAG: SpoVA/SpoVAEb family sporulation membrane protein [Clostridia bacterium]
MIIASLFMYLKVFVIGGLICLIGEIIVVKTKFTTGRILVLFLMIGALLGGLGIYNYIVEFAGAGATVPISGFGNALAQGAINAVKTDGLLGALSGGLIATSAGISMSIGLSYLIALFSSSKTKKH